MPIRNPVAKQIVEQTLRRFPNMPERAIARYLMANNKGVFSCEEHARSAIRNLNPERIALIKKRFKENGSMFSQVMKRPAYNLPFGSWGVLSDVHCPQHEPVALEAAFKFFKREKITGILINGDFQDCEGVGFWPSIGKRDFLNEVELTIDLLDFIRSEFPKVKIVYQAGNHEERLDRYYRQYAPMIADMPTAGLDIALGLEQRGVEYLERKQKIVAGKLTILHGHEMRISNTSVSPARSALLKAKSCIAIGHFHRPSFHASQTLEGKRIAAWSFGCLCNLSPDYNPYANDWEWGTAIIHHDKDGFEVDSRRIFENGKLH